jgi:hypothetical protein
VDHEYTKSKFSSKVLFILRKGQQRVNRSFSNGGRSKHRFLHVLSDPTQHPLYYPALTARRGEEGDSVAVGHGLGDVVHLLHELAVSLDVPLAVSLLVPKSVEGALRRRGREPHGSRHDRVSKSCKRDFQIVPSCQIG